MSSFQSRIHRLDMTHTGEGVVHTAVCHLDQVVLDRLVNLSGVDEVCRTELTGNFFLAVIDIDGDDAGSALADETLDDRKSDRTHTEDSGCRAFFNLNIIFYRFQTGRYTAAQETDLVHRCLIRNLTDIDVIDHCIFRESRRSHEMIEILAFIRETGCSVTHDTFTLRVRYCRAEV